MTRLPYTITLVLLSALLLSVGVASGDEPCWCRVASPVVMDGDTVHGDVLLPWGVTLRGESIRAADYDAAESSKRRQSVEVTDAEVEIGKRATADYAALVDGGNLYVAPVARSRDVYGRLLGKFRVVTKDGERIDMRDWMDAKGYLRSK